MTLVRQMGEWISAQVGTDRVMMNVASGHYVGMTAVGAQIWDLLADHQSLDALCEQLQHRYDVDRRICETEVRAFLDDLAKLGAVTFEAAEP